MFEEVVRNFGKSNSAVKLFSEKMLITTKCVYGFVSIRSKNIGGYLEKAYF